MFNKKSNNLLANSSVVFLKLNSLFFCLGYPFKKNTRISMIFFYMGELKINIIHEYTQEGF